MRHRQRGRKLGRSPSHRRAMFRNMACSLIRSVRVDEDAENKPEVPGRIVTTVAKAKELRPFVEKLVTIARKAAVHQEQADSLKTAAERNSDEWRNWRNSSEWNEWNQAVAPAVAYRRRAFAILRDNEAVDILFNELAEQFSDRPGGYTRVIRLATVRLGDSGAQALIEFVGGDRDRVKSARQAPVVTTDEGEEEEETVAADESSAAAEVEESEATEQDVEESLEQESSETDDEEDSESKSE